MRLRAPVIALSSLLLAACAGKTEVAVQAPTIEVPPQIDDEATFVAALNDLALSEPGAPERAQLRAMLLEYIVAQGRAHARAEDWEALMSDVELAVALWRPAELRELHPRDPGLVELGRDLYRASARQGLERESLFALAVQRQFGTTEDAGRVEREWAALVGWIEQSQGFSRDPQALRSVDGLLEEVAAVFPSPWVVDQLSAIYIQRGQGGRRSLIASTEPDPAEYAGYLLIRLHLRADDPEGALRALDQIPANEVSETLRELLTAMLQETPTSQPYDDIIAYMVPTSDDEASGRLPDYVITQGWGIVESMALRALRDHPEDAIARMELGRAYHRAGLQRAALFHMRQVIDQQGRAFETWQEMVALEHAELERLSEQDPEAAAKALPAVEELHHQAQETWRDRPLEPGLLEAYLVVASGLYSGGFGDAARGLLERSIALEPRPEALDLMARVHLGQGRPEAATDAYDTLLALPFDSASGRQLWELRARQQLGEIAIRAGRIEEGRGHLRAALEELNYLLNNSLPPELASALLTDRGRVFFHLDELELSRQDFRRAGELDPGSTTSYADAMVLAASYGRVDLGRQTFEAAVTQDEIPADLKLYWAMWVSDLTLRSGEPQPASARELIAGFEGDAWLEALAQHAGGELSYEGLLERADDRGQRCEAHYYEALSRARSSDFAAGQALLKKSMDTGMLSFFEYQFAQRFLAWGEIPGKPRPAAK